MALLDHIRHCNNADPARYAPLLVGAETLGRIRRDRMPWFLRFPDSFVATEDALILNPDLRDPAARDAAFDAVGAAALEDGLIESLRGERYPGVPNWGAAPRFTYDRALAPLLGVRAFGVHLTGYVRRRDGLHIWVATRARHRPSYPGMLDQIVAGGQPAGLGLRENLAKEAAEEASIPPDLIARARPVGCITYRHETEEGLKPDCMFCFDLELPEGFAPRNTDGEIERFDLMPAEAVLDLVRETGRFKFNCNLVLIDFFIRHGLIDPDSEPDYVAVAAGLRTTV